MFQLPRWSTIVYNISCASNCLRLLLYWLSCTDPCSFLVNVQMINQTESKHFLLLLLYALRTLPQFLLLEVVMRSPLFYYGTQPSLTNMEKSCVGCECKIGLTFFTFLISFLCTCTTNKVPSHGINTGHPPGLRLLFVFCNARAGPRWMMTLLFFCLKCSTFALWYLTAVWLIFRAEEQDPVLINLRWMPPVSLDLGTLHFFCHFLSFSISNQSQVHGLPMSVQHEYFRAHYLHYCPHLKDFFFFFLFFLFFFKKKWKFHSTSQSFWPTVIFAESTGLFVM